MKTLLVRLTRAGDTALPLLARAIFAAVLSGYFWASGLTKLDGPLTPSLGAYVQIYPRAMEAAGFDLAQMSGLHTLVVLAGAWAELILPALIVLGLATRLAGLGMVGFTLVQSLTDLLGHKAGPEVVGAWFDRASDALILDQRALWIMLFAVLVLKGAGPVSLDRLVAVRLAGGKGKNAPQPAHRNREHGENAKAEGEPDRR